MAGSTVQASINRVWRDGPETVPHEPEKPEIRDDFGATLASEIDSIIASVDDAVEDLTGLITTGVKLPFDPVVFRTTTTGALATAFVAGTVHDGHTAVAGERFFMDARTSGAENGIYTVPASGAPTRTTDADQGAELPGTYFLVSQGTVAAGNVYACATPGPITIGTTVLKFVKTGQSQSAVLPTLSAGAPVTDPVDTQFVLLNAAGTAPLRMSWANLLAKINGEVMGPQQYTWPAHGRATDSSAEIIPADAGIIGFDVANPGTSDLWVAEGNLQASIGGLGSIQVMPGGLYSTDKALPGAISIISASPTPVTCKYWTTTNFNAAGRQAAKAYTDKVNSLLSSAMTTAQVTALQDFYSKLYSAGALNTLGALYNLLAPGLATNINLCDLNGKTATLKGGVTRTNWRYASFDGTSGYFDTQRYISEMASDNDHCLLVYPADATQQGSSRVAIGDGNITLTPNRTATTAAGRSRQTSPIVFSDVAAGAGLYSLSRLDTDRVIVRKGQTIDVTLTSVSESSISNREILIGARNGGLTGGEDVPASGSFYLGPLVLAGAGRRISSAMHKAIDTAVAELIAATGAF